MKTDQLTIIASNGIKIREYRNLALVPAFYYLPKYDLELCDPWVFQIPRNPHHIINNPKALELIESDRFQKFLLLIWQRTKLRRCNQRKRKTPQQLKWCCGEFSCEIEKRLKRST